MLAPSFYEVYKWNAKLQVLEAVLMDFRSSENLCHVSGEFSVSTLGSSIPSFKTPYPKVLANLRLDVKMGILCSFESSVNISQSKWHNIAEDLALHSNGLIKGLGKSKIYA